ncbi:MAG: hypothetical protein QF486_04635 [Candidatus Woesearchaeota archaeon]|jgi:hypothetical protein|nr:hypothetical protein [Candidatus Woesearchaeota archaeon]MDP7181788.1 hypothetical protein [Candidatus Woesearchaeota archaeon]MDP7198877.1 hypothetical protein [Candidatus Woesearchaeota archaeon]MDP7467123.1 hypothetical protein [Candidatus Woesearchaeota archaeon]MDP7647542.1 hypothetical protein [Candidatus Woesearchaeota archaeon]|tara:strand:+ start:316 stop:1329 length:1014 start_codon:yes stop_codon:yes gene_type:complete
MDARVKDYVQSLLAQGWTEEQVLQYMANAGYPSKDVEHVIHGPTFTLNKMLLIVGFLVLVTAGILFVPKMMEETVLDMSTSVVSTTPERVAASVRIDSSSSKTVAVKVAIILLDGAGRTVKSKQERAEFEGSTVLPVSFDVKDLPPGKYEFRASLVFDDKRISDSANVNVPEKVAKQPKQVVLQPTEDVQDCPGGCDDLNACTSDSCVKGLCENVPKPTCCGNGNCDADESAATCPRDCVAAKRKTYAEIIDDSEKLAAQSPDQAADQCASLLVVPQADLCFSQVARASEKSEFCNAIQTISNRDDCYAAFAQKEPEACDKIADTYLQSACFSLSAS